MTLKADRIFKNGEVYSPKLGGGLDINEAFAIKKEEIIFTGSNEAVGEYADEKTKITDLKGKTVLPGLTDSHIHASSTAEMLYSFSLYDTMQLAEKGREVVLKECLNILGSYLKENKDIPVLRGTGWDATFFLATPEGLPTCKDIDTVCPDIPVVLRSYDHHYIWVNSKAMKMANIDKNTPTPRNGVIVRDKDENPTGIFQEATAIDLLINNLSVADYSQEEYREAILAFQKDYANEYGTTLIFDAYPSKRAIRAYNELAIAGKLTLRVKGCYYADPSREFSQFDGFIENKTKYDVRDIFQIKTVKFFIDGSGLSFFMKEPFEAEFLKEIGFPENYVGYSQWTFDELKKAFEKLNAGGFQIHCHCMGDGAVSLALDAFEHVSVKEDIKSNRHVIAHVMNTDESEMKRMANLGVIAAMQPCWGGVTSLEAEVGTHITGNKRSLNQYPVGRLFKAGVMVTSGTDFPVVVPPNPFEGIQTGMTRKITKLNPDFEKCGSMQMGPDSDKMSMEEMIRTYCINGAYQCFLENVTGSIQIGKSADFVVLDKKLTQVPVEDIVDVHANEVYFKGKKVK